MDDILCGEGREHELYELEEGSARCLECGFEVEITDPFVAAEQRRVA